MPAVRSHDNDRARSSTYALFSEVFREGIAGGAGRTLLSLPEFSDLDIHGSDDEQAAEFESLFGFNVFPYASAFLEPDGRLGGEVSNRVNSIYVRAGLADPAASTPADHIAGELLFLSRLSEHRAGATDGLTSALDDITAEFLDGHVLAWLPALNAAIQSRGHPFYSRVAGYALDLVVDHRKSLEEPVATKDVWLPEAPALLDDPSAGLREIAGFLTTPVWCGLFLSRDDITACSRIEGLPRGFGERRQMMENVLRSAVSYGSIEGLTDHLSSRVDSWKTAWKEAHALNVGTVPAWSECWIDRLKGTQAMLDRLRREAHAT